MLGVTDLPTYLAGLVLIVLLPGPNSLYVLSVAARSGIRTGYTAAAGVWCGDAVLMTLSAAGVGLAAAGERAAVRDREVRRCRVSDLAGDRDAAGRVGDVADPEGAGARPRPWPPGAEERPFRRALVISLFNPKAILFFVAFFVQFVDPGYAYPALSFVVLGAFAQLASFLYLTALIFSGTKLAAAFRGRRRLSAGATSAAGALFLGFAVKLSLASAV